MGSNPTPSASLGQVTDWHKIEAACLRCNRTTMLNISVITRARMPRGQSAAVERREVNRVAMLVMAAKQSVDFCGYWQRHVGGVN